jgi:hypothetical protein
MPRIFEEDGYRFFFYSNEHGPTTFTFDMEGAKRCSLWNRASSSGSLTD